MVNAQFASLFFFSFPMVKEERSDTVEMHAMMSDAWNHPSLSEMNILALNHNEQINPDHCNKVDQGVAGKSQQSKDPCVECTPPHKKEMVKRSVQGNEQSEFP